MATAAKRLVEVWSVRADVAAAPIEGPLRESERERLRRFRRPDDRERFALGRSLLRFIAEAHARQAQERLEINLLDGSPAGPSGTPCFSLSHAGDLVVAAYCGSARVGIDTEPLTNARYVSHVLSRVASEVERQQVESAPSSLRADALVQLWTRKEAVLKAAGTGLCCDPTEVQVIASVCAHRGVQWTLKEVPVAAEFKTSLAVDGTDVSVLRRSVCRLELVAWAEHRRELLHL